MPITNASKLADFASGASSTNTSVIQVDYTNQRVGIGTTNPQTALNVVGVVSATSLNVTTVSAAGSVTATSFFGSGANLTGVISGVEIKSAGTSVGTGITNINFVGATATATGAASTVTITVTASFNELDSALFS